MEVPIWDYTLVMRVIALSTLKSFWEDNPGFADVKEPVLAWYRHTLRADWATPADVKADFGHASILRDGRVVFNIAGNKYRLVARLEPTKSAAYWHLLPGHPRATRLGHSYHQQS